MGIDDVRFHRICAGRGQADRAVQHDGQVFGPSDLPLLRRECPPARNSLQLNIIAKLRDAVTRAIDKLVTFVAKKAKKLFSKLIAKINSKRKLPSANFQIGNTPHRIFAEKAGKKIDIFVESQKQTSDQALSGMQQQIPDFKAKASPETLAEIVAFINTFDKEEADAEKKAGKVDPASQKQPALKTVEDLKKELEQGSER